MIGQNDRSTASKKASNTLTKEGTILNLLRQDIDWMRKTIEENKLLLETIPVNQLPPEPRF